MKIAVIGLGKAGLPLAAVIADGGFEVVGVDVDEKKCEMINKGVNPIPEEAGLDELIKKYGGKNLIATTNYKDAEDCNVYIVIVPLYVDENYNPDFGILENAFRNVGRILKKGDSVVLETTVPVGTTENIVKRWLEEESGLRLGEFHLAYSPERIMTGYSISRLKEFSKVIGGVDKKSGQIAFEVYKRFIPNLHLVSSARVAEFIKIIEGCYRDVNIALANELFKIAEELGVDFYDARQYANHEYCHIHLPSTGVGGHCFSKDEYVFVDGINPITFEEFYNSVEGDVKVIGNVEIKMPKKDCSVLSFDLNEKKAVFRKVTILTKRRLNDNENVFEITLKTGRKIRLTENHIVLVYKNGEFVQQLVRELKPSDKIAIVAKLSTISVRKKVNLIEILNKSENFKVKFNSIDAEDKRSIHRNFAPQSYDYLKRKYIPLNHSIKTCDEIKLKPVAITSGRGKSYQEVPCWIDVNTDFAKSIGYVSEGCITEDKSLRVRLSFNAKEREYIRDVKKILSKLGLRFLEYIQNGVHHLKVSSRAFGLLLESLGVGRNSYDAKIPSFILNDTELTKAVLSGFINGDGSVCVYEGEHRYRRGNKIYKTDRIGIAVEIATSSDKLAQQLFLALQNLEIVPSYKKAGNVHILRIFGYENVKRLKDCVDGSKREKIEYYLSKVKKIESNSSFELKDGFALIEVKDVKRIDYDDYVYSIEVDDTNTVVTTTGIVVHNCIPVYPWFLIKEMEKREKFDYARLLRTAREINDEMINYWAERIVLECLKVGKPLKDVEICIKGITFRKGVKELYHSRNLALARLLIKKGLNVFVYDEMFNKEEVEKLGLRWIEPNNADVVFDPFELKITRR